MGWYGMDGRMDELPPCKLQITGGDEGAEPEPEEASEVDGTTERDRVSRAVGSSQR